MAVTVRVPPARATTAATTSLSEVSALQVSGSPSGSVKCGASSSVSASSLKRVRGAIECVGTGGRLGTVTWKVCAADAPSLSVAVTVTCASPLASAVTVSVAPATDAATLVLSDTAAA